MRRGLAVALAAALTGSVGILPRAEANLACSAASMPGGEWRSYGGDVANTRSQPAETTIGTARAQALTPAWTLRMAAVGASGLIQSTPVVAAGCVFVHTHTEWVIALDATTGELQWKTQLPVTNPGFNAGASSVAYDNGKVFVAGNEIGKQSAGTGPYLARLDASTGAIEATTLLDTLDTEFVNASPVPFNGMILVGLGGFETSPRARGGYAIVDQDTMEMIVHRYTIDDVDYAKGYAGASVWATPAVDPIGGYAYLATGNPASKKIEHDFSNALLKVDVDPARATFGDIVASYKGTHDAYSRTLSQQPACDLTGDYPAAQYFGSWSATCLQQDLDFGASPNLFRSNGRLIIGDVQKSGIYHAAFADQMTNAFALPVGAPGFPFNAASGAVVGDKIYVAATPPGQMVALDGTRRTYQWVAPIGDGMHYQGVSAANGVVYTTDGQGFLNAYDAANGVLLLHRSMSADAAPDRAGGTVSSGIAIANNMIYAASGAVMVVYR